MLDEFRALKMIWSKASQPFFERLKVNASDEKGRKLVVRIDNDGMIQNLLSENLFLYWELQNKSGLSEYQLSKNEHFGLESFTAVNRSAGIFELYFPTGMLKHAGALVANFVLSDNTGMVVSTKFIIDIEAGINKDAIESSDGFSQLLEALQGLSSFNVKINAVEDKTIINKTNIALNKTDIAVNKNSITNLLTDVNDHEQRIESLEDRTSGKSFKKAINLTPITDQADGTFAWNGCPYIQDNLTIYNGHQYGVYVGSARTLMVFKRKLPDGKMTFFDIGTVPALATEMRLPTTKNSHCTYSIGIDKNGFIHISGNMHAHVLRYIKSTNPENITSWQVGQMTGSGEDSVTYPMFVKTPDKDLLFFYRSGGSGSSELQINRYNPIAKNWTKVQSNLASGRASGEGIYLNHVAVDKDGTIHIMFMWRNNGGAGVDNKDVGYARSKDKGMTWENSKGVPYVLPITHSSQETAMVSSGKNLLNQSGLETDLNNRPHGAFIQNDSAGKTQIYHLYNDGTKWINRPVTQFETVYDMSTGAVDYTLSRPSIFTTKDNRVYIIYRKNNEGYKGSLRMIDVTPGEEINDFEILKIDLQNQEVTFDTQALYERHELHMIVGKMVSDGTASKVWNVGLKTDIWNHEDNWNAQPIWILTIDLDAIADVQKETVPLYKIKMVSQGYGMTSGDIRVTNTTFAPLGIAGIMIDYDLKGKQLFGRFMVRSELDKKTDATRMELQLVLNNELDGAIGERIPVGTITETLTSTRRRITPWLPMPKDINSQGAFIDVHGKIDAGAGRITLLTFEVGVLEKG